MEVRDSGKYVNNDYITFFTRRPSPIGMRLRDALGDYQRSTDHPRQFPGERRTVTGLFAGDEGRLVHVNTDGTLRDFGYPLSWLSGLARARLGVGIDGEVTWFSDGEQAYHGETTTVVTDHEVGDHRLTQYDWTVDGTHLTHVAWPDAPDGATLVAQATFAPDGRDDRVGHLRHEDVVEVFHAREHDYLASATGFDDVEGRVERLDNALAGGRASRPDGRYEESKLSGTVRVAAPVVEGRATLASRVTAEPDRATELASIREQVAGITEESVRAAAHSVPDVPSTVPQGAVPGDQAAPARRSIVADLRVLSLLAAPGGLRIAGPDFDPFYTNSGGYGYTWFRDDSEIARFCLAADRRLGLGLDRWHARSARRYIETQLPDGTWPHRVWPVDGSLAPGWAHARLEAGDDVSYQADQTASVVAFLADYADAAPAELRPDIIETIEAALGGLDDSLAADGRPATCQNAWENMDGRFTHTAATFLGAYSACAVAGPLGEDVREHAREQATAVYEALDALWVPEEARYALRERPDGTIDARLDSATFALAGAHRAYDAAVGVDATRRDRLVEHVEGTIAGLARETAAISGLARFEGDEWRRRDQPRSKVWTVSTGWGAHACTELAALLTAHDDQRSERLATRGRTLLAALEPDGPLSVGGGYLPEQFFDDGTPDSATPLGWSHAIRLATTAVLLDDDLLSVEPAASDD